MARFQFDSFNISNQIGVHEHDKDRLYEQAVQKLNELIQSDQRLVSLDVEFGRFFTFISVRYVIENVTNGENVNADTLPPWLGGTPIRQNKERCDSCEGYNYAHFPDCPMGKM